MVSVGLRGTRARGVWQHTEDTELEDFFLGERWFKGTEGTEGTRSTKVGDEFEVSVERHRCGRVWGAHQGHVCREFCVEA